MIHSTALQLVTKGPGCVKSRTDAMIFFLNSAVGSDECQALWRGLIGAKAVCSQPNLKTMWPRTIRFVRLTLLLYGLDLGKLGFGRVAPLERGRPCLSPGDAA